MASFSSTYFDNLTKTPAMIPNNTLEPVVHSQTVKMAAIFYAVVSFVLLMSSTTIVDRNKWQQKYQVILTGFMFLNLVVAIKVATYIHSASNLHP